MKRYIGERYVPVIAGNWSSSAEYEPLTIVVYNGSSYTSKKYVPAGVLPTDAEYWALTGIGGEIDNRVGDLANLDTTDKTSIVTAINEVVTRLATISDSLGTVALTVNDLKNRTTGQEYSGDLNTLTVPGLYYAGPASNKPTIPSATGMVIVGSYAGSQHVFQLFFAYDGDNQSVWTRQRPRSLTTWTAWQKLEFAVM